MLRYLWWWSPPAWFWNRCTDSLFLVLSQGSDASSEKLFSTAAVKGMWWTFFIPFCLYVFYCSVANHSCVMVDGFYCFYRGTYSKWLWLFFPVKWYFKRGILLLLIDLEMKIIITVCKNNPGLYNIMQVTVKHAIFDASQVINWNPSHYSRQPYLTILHSDYA